MREIKFRAWDKAKKEMINDYCELDRLFLTFSGYDLTNDAYVKIASVMQFTGLLDTNKKEIYEGDIVSVSIYGDEKPSILEVHWQYGGFFIDYEDSESDMVLVANFVGSVEVIGNIYENEDLLTEIR
jgi:uncharacterized phage protein (TIGR01671 family)